MYAKKLTGLLFALLAVWAFGAQAGPKIQTWTSANGARVYYVPTEGLPMVDIRVVFDAGSARDGAQFG